MTEAQTESVKTHKAFRSKGGCSLLRAYSMKKTHIIFIIK